MQRIHSYTRRRRKRTRISGSAAAAGKLRFRSEMLGALSAATHAARSVSSRKCDSNENHFSVQRVLCLVNGGCLNILTFVYVPWVEKRATCISMLVSRGGYTGLSRSSPYATRISWGLGGGICLVKEHFASGACIYQKSLVIDYLFSSPICMLQKPHDIFASFSALRPRIAEIVSDTLACEKLSVCIIPYFLTPALLT
jgi:hypothetical protein